MNPYFSSLIDFGWDSCLNFGWFNTKCWYSSLLTMLCFRSLVGTCSSQKSQVSLCAAQSLSQFWSSPWILLMVFTDKFARLQNFTFLPACFRWCVYIWVCLNTWNSAMSCCLNNSLFVSSDQIEAQKLSHMSRGAFADAKRVFLCACLGDVESSFNIMSLFVFW